MYERIMVCVDGSPTANKALVAALQLATESGGRAQLRLVHVVDEAAFALGLDQTGGYSAELYKAMQDQGTKVIGDAMAIVQAAGVKADHVLFDTFGQRLGDTVAKAARDWPADLVVVGTHGRRGVAHLFLGSGAEQVIRLAPVPVLVVRSTEDAEWIAA
jgi:nucleotide-binding universal stress UspA family protein